MGSANHPGLVLFDTRDAVAVVLRLALGIPRFEDARADWSVVFETASQEMLAALAWMRSALFIRRHAPNSVVAAWRRAALAAQVRGERQLRVLEEAMTALDTVGVNAVVLKGLPLGERLYGDAFVRCSADIDLYVSAPERARAAAALRGLGWRSTDGAAPWHESWSTTRGNVEYCLELHSFLVSDHLTHVAAPPPMAMFARVGDVDLRVHTGEFVAPYLAAHLATHQMPPLLWLLDFGALWSGMTDVDRVRARAAAADAGLTGYLTWSIERASLIDRVAADDWEAFGALGIESGRRRDVHSIWRHMALAASHVDRARLLAAFIVPRRVRGNFRSFVRYTIARLRTRLGALGVASRTYDLYATGAERPDDGRPLTLARDEMVAFTRDVVGAGGALQVRAPGGSMLPTIPRGALVRIGPVPVIGVRRGDVILLLTSDGEPVIHRVVAVRGDTVVTRGDAANHTDPPVPIERVIGLATHVRHDGMDRAIGRRPRRSLAVSALKIRRRLARMVRRAR